MKHHQFLLCLALLGVILLWSGCEDEDDPTNPTCTVNVPTISAGSDCNPDIFYLENLDQRQMATRPNLPYNCTNTFNERILRIEEPADGDFYLQLYVGVAATVHYQVFGADCADNAFPITECLESDAVAVSEFIISGRDFEDVYVVIDYTLFTAADHLTDYVLGPDEFIGVAIIDELPQVGAIDYRDQGSSFEGPGRLPFSCDGTTFQRLVIGSCNPQANVSAWAQEMGLTVTETHNGGGGTTMALEVPEGMSPNALGGMGDKPVTKPRRPKADSSDYFIEEDYIIEISTFGNGLFDGNDINIPEEAVACLRYETGNGSMPGDDNVFITMIDSGVEEDGPFQGDYEKHAYQGNYTSGFIQPEQLGYDFIRGDASPDDEIGHGTATGGTVIGGYRGNASMSMFHSKIFGGEGLASYFGAIVAINEAVDMNSTIINMSWGIPQAEPPRALECAVLRADSRDIIMVTTAGNEDLNIENEPQWPGAFGLRTGFDNVITVASMEYPGNSISEAPIKADFSNFSDLRVNVAAYLTSQSPRFQAMDENDFSYVAGTSISAPLITRSLAGYLGPNGSSRAQWAADKLRQSVSLETENQVKDGLFLPACADF